MRESEEEIGTPKAAAALRLVIDATGPDVVLLAVHLPKGGGVSVLSAVVGREGAPAFLALSASDAASDVIEVVRAGARGYVTKTIPTEDLVAAIAQVAVVFAPSPGGRQRRRASNGTVSSQLHLVSIGDTATCGAMVSRVSPGRSASCPRRRETAA